MCNLFLKPRAYLTSLALLQNYELDAEDCLFPVAYYQVHVQCGKDSWTVRKRYSEFFQLMLEMQEAFPQLESHFADAMPPKTALGIRIVSTEFVEQRAAALNEFLSISLKMEGVGQLPCVRTFVQLDSQED